MQHMQHMRNIRIGDDTRWLCNGTEVTRQRVHSTPDPDAEPPAPQPNPDDVPSPTRAPVQEPPSPTVPPIKARRYGAEQSWLH